MNETTGLRERKKAETRAAISRAVMRLAVDRGLDAMTSEDIAAAANVSVRTYHNYFGSKEEALTGGLADGVPAPRRRPPQPSRRRADPRLARARLRRHRRGRAGSSPTRLPPHVDLLWTSQALAKHRSVLIDEAIRMITEVVAARTGTDPDVDVYPHLVTSVAISAIVTAFQFAPAGRAAEPDHERLLHECFELLRTGLIRPGEALP